VTAIIIAAGPSLTQADVDLCRGKGLTIAVSESWRMAPWADVLYACDLAWWKHRGGVPDFAGLKLSRQDATALGVAKAPDPARLGSDSAFTVSGGNSGYQAILLAAGHLLEQGGARRILLLGFDCQDGPAGEKHWHGRHPAPLNNPGPANYARWLGWFDRLAPALAGLGVEVINCSRATAIAAFPRMDLETALCS
jgi:hypothetical protein